MNSPVIDFYTNNLVDFYNVDEIKINMNNNNIYVQGDLRDYYNKYLKEQEEQVDEDILQKSEKELNEFEKKYIQDSLKRLFNQGSVGLEVPSIENVFKAFIPDINAMNKQLSSSFSEMGKGMKDGATSLQSQARSIKEQTKTYLSKKIFNMNTRIRLKFILQRLSEEELNELEEYIKRNIENQNPIAVPETTDNDENEFDEDEELEMM